MLNPGLGRAMLLAALLGVAMPAQALSCLLFPLSCLVPKKKYGEEIEATVLRITKERTDHYIYHMDTGMTTADPLENTREFYVYFRVSQTLYIAWKKDTVIQMAGLLGGYSPKREQWEGKPIKMRFMDENTLGLKAAVAAFKTPEGKEWKLAIVGIIGPDGVDECKGHVLCPFQADVDRPAREAAILAKLKAERQPTVWESPPPAAPAALAAGPAAAPAEQGAAAAPSAEPGATSTTAPAAPAAPPADQGAAPAAPAATVATPATEPAAAPAVAAPAGATPSAPPSTAT